MPTQQKSWLRRLLAGGEAQTQSRIHTLAPTGDHPHVVAGDADEHHLLVVDLSRMAGGLELGDDGQ